jgi:hypothetical protein
MKTRLKLVASRPPEKVFGSPGFISIGRNVKLASPERFEPTIKEAGDVVI